MNISGNLDLVDYKLIRLGNSTGKTDAVNKRQLDTVVSDSESATRALIETKNRRIRRSINKSCTKRKCFSQSNG